MTEISLQTKFALTPRTLAARVIASLNGQEVKLVKLCGIFPWHAHSNEDEKFLVWSGLMVIEFRDHAIESTGSRFVRRIKRN